MKTTTTLFLIAISLSFAAAAAAESGDVAKLDWITGCWSGQAGPMTFEEQWNRPQGGQMMGLGRVLRRGKVVSSEFMRIDQTKDGISYTPRIGTKDAPVSFKLTSQNDGEVIFENPTHDFPQRILYRKTPGGLFARIDGMEKGKAKAEDFPMKSVPCQ